MGMEFKFKGQIRVLNKNNLKLFVYRTNFAVFSRYHRIWKRTAVSQPLHGRIFVIIIYMNLWRIPVTS